jgi:hypothetical protein
MMAMACRQGPDPVAAELLPVYLSFVHYTQNDDGTFRNFMNFNRTFLDSCGSEDSFGRAVWAMGYLVAYPPGDGYQQTAREIFNKAAPNFRKLQSPRGIANSLIGISYYLQRFSSDMEMAQQAGELAGKLVTLFHQCRDDHWKWFEPIMTYDNAVLPLSLLHAYSVLNDKALLDVAMETMDFLASVTLKKGWLSVVGNEKWYAKGAEMSDFAQQPVDVMVTILMFRKAFLLTNDQTFFDHLCTSFKWFLGENDLRISLYDTETKGCCDGLESYGVNKNQGAESTLAYMISHLAVQRVLASSVPGEESEGSMNVAQADTVKVIAV